MTTPTHAHTAMTRPPDAPQPDPPKQAVAAEPAPAQVSLADPAPAEAAAPPRSTGRAGWTTVSDNLIPALLSAALVAVMIFAFTTLDNRITSLENRLTAFENRVDARFAQIDTRFAAQDAKIEALDTKIDARFTAQDAKIEALDAKIDEINVKLTALIAALNRTEEVDAALAGEITTNVPPASDIG